jgi:hypothetical protein
LKMSYPIQNGFSNDSGGGDAEATLRLIAKLAAPDGLEDRVHARLITAPRRGRVLAWPGAVIPAGGWLRAAAAAAIVCVVAGGGWGVYSRVQPGQSAQGIAGTHITSQGAGQGAGQGQFSTGDAVRRPSTLNGPAAPAAVTAATPRHKTPTKAAATTKQGAKAKTAKKANIPPVAPVAQ